MISIELIYASTMVYSIFNSDMWHSKYAFKITLIIKVASFLHILQKYSSFNK